MRRVKVPGLDIQIPPGSAFKIGTPLMMPKMHLLAAVVAPRGYPGEAAAVEPAAAPQPALPAVAEVSAADECTDCRGRVVGGRRGGVIAGRGVSVVG